jgi:membrane protein implicated in regulation of membrane protease activity
MKTGLVPLIVAIAMGLLALYGLVTATSPWIRYGSITLIVLAVAVVVFRWVKRRPKKTSLDGVLRSRREHQAP